MTFLPRRLTVYCGSQPGRDPVYAEAARALGRAMAARGVELVYGGGSIGLMGVCADTVLAGGGKVTGVIPRSLFVREVGHRGLTTCTIVESMHERKAIMVDLADAFVVLPGAFGTLDEMFEVLTWGQLGIHEKPVVLVNVNDYWTPLLAAVDVMVARGFLRKEHRALLNSVSSAEAALDLIAAWKQPFPVEKWLGRDVR